MPAAFTDLFNEALDDLTATLTAVAGLQVCNDPRNLVPPCALIEAFTFEGYNYNIAKLGFTIRLVTLGPGNLDAQRSLLNMASKVLAANIGVLEGKPTTAIIGGAEYAAYDLFGSMQAQTG